MSGFMLTSILVCVIFMLGVMLGMCLEWYYLMAMLGPMAMLWSMAMLGATKDSPPKKVRK